VTSFHDPEFPARANTSQNAGSADIGTTAQSSAVVAIEVAMETVPDARPGAPDTDADEAVEDPHAATAPVAASITAAASHGTVRIMACSWTEGRSRP
jgi:hypothetical protein